MRRLVGTREDYCDVREKMRTTCFSKASKALESLEAYAMTLLQGVQELEDFVEFFRWLGGLEAGVAVF